MRIPRLCSLLLLVHACCGRPHQTDTNGQTTADPKKIELVNLEDYFAPGTWQPVVSDTTSRTHQLHIDQDTSRVRLETGDGGKQRGGKSQNVAVFQEVNADNATQTQTSANQIARAKQSPALGDSIQSLANQLLGFGKESDESERDSINDNSNDSMVEEDVRTPPKFKSQIKQKQNNQHTKTVTSTTHRYVEPEDVHHKGVAFPVIIEDDEDVEKTIEKISNTEPLGVPQIFTYTTTKKRHPIKVTASLPSTTTTSKPYYETTSSDGVSTWIFLSGSSSTTPAIKRKNNKTPTATPTTSTSYLGTTVETTTKRFVETVNSNINNSPSKFVPPVTQSPNWTQTIDFFKPTRTRKPHPTRTTTLRTTTTPTTQTATTKRHPSNQQSNSHKVVNRVTTIKPPVVTIIRVPDIPSQEEINTISSTGNSAEVNTTELSTEVSTNETNRPTSNKKRKKNKNRRRRPSKKPGSSENPESKIDESNGTSSVNKISVKERPLSTQIYNYLAREVMPSVGVGLIGLVVTAGLAGLFLYPFGGGVTRRTYEVSGHHPIQPNTYYQGDMEGGQSEEEVFGKLLEGMNDKGEFTYSGIGEETSGYAGVSGMDSDLSNQKNNRYNTGNSRVEDTGLRYDNGYMYRDIERYKGSQIGANDNNASQTFSQQHTVNVRTGSNNFQQSHNYPAITTRSGEIIESQPIISSEYGEDYFKPQYANFQPQMDEMYKGLAVVGSQNYGKAQFENKPDTVHISDIKIGDTSYKTIRNPETGGYQYRTVVSDKKQQYVDVTGTQPRSGGTLVAASLTKQENSRTTRNDMLDNSKFKPMSPQEDQGNNSEEKPVANDRTLEVQSDSDNDNLRYSGLSHEASRVSPELHSGLVQHGPRNLRNKRNVDDSSKSKIQMASSKSNDISSSGADIKDNEIDNDDKNSRKKENVKNISSQSKGRLEVTVLRLVDKKMENSSKDPLETTNAEEDSTTQIEDNDLVTELKTDVTTSDDEIPTTTYYTTENVKDTEEKTVISPITIRHNETSSNATKNKTVTNKVQNTHFSLLGLFQRIARFKLQMGLNLLKSTSQAFTNYIDQVQKRIDKDYYHDYRRSREGKRQRRAIVKSDVSGKKLEDMLKNKSKKEHISIFKIIQKAVMN